MSESLIAKRVTGRPMRRRVRRFECLLVTFDVRHTCNESGENEEEQTQHCQES